MYQSAKSARTIIPEMKKIKAGWLLAKARAEHTCVISIRRSRNVYKYTTSFLKQEKKKKNASLFRSHIITLRDETTVSGRANKCFFFSFWMTLKKNWNLVKRDKMVKKKMLTNTWQDKFAVLKVFLSQNEQCESMHHSITHDSGKISNTINMLDESASDMTGKKRYLRTLNKIFSL